MNRICYGHFHYKQECASTCQWYVEGAERCPMDVPTEDWWTERDYLHMRMQAQKNTKLEDFK